MSLITVIENKLVSLSRFIKLRRVKFLEGGQERTWDYITVSFGEASNDVEHGRSVCTSFRQVTFDEGFHVE